MYYHLKNFNYACRRTTTKRLCRGYTKEVSNVLRIFKCPKFVFFFI